MVIIDSFEDGSFDGYTEHVLSGSVQRTTSTSTVQFGTFSGQLDLSPPGFGSASGAVVSDTETASPGDTIVCWVRLPDVGSFYGPVFGWQDSNNAYYVVIGGGTVDETGIWKIDGGNTVELALSTHSYGSSWYEIEVEWGFNGVIDVIVRDSGGGTEDTVIATDESHGSGSLGYWFNGDFNASNSVWFDNEGTGTGGETFSQTLEEQLIW